MSRMAETSSSAGRVQRRRDKLRAAGLRPLQIWVPDTRAPGFTQECARQSRLIRDAEASGDDAWFDASDKNGWTE
jgi:hypothetical protein